MQSLWEDDSDVLLRLSGRESFIFKSKSAMPGVTIPRPLPFSATWHTAPRVERSDCTPVYQGMKMLMKQFCCALCAYSYTIHAQRCLVVVLIPGTVTCSFHSKHTALSYMHFMTFLWRFSEHDKLGGDPGADSELTGGITYFFWPRNALGSPRRSWKPLLGRGMSEIPWIACCHRDLTLHKQKMHGWIYFSHNFLSH